jgi:3-methyladenine DNA glycosylase/8-oxoguanine DNA glycosylase
VPVDIHIYKIALRDYQLDLNSSTTTKKNPANRSRPVGAKNKKESELDRSPSVRTKPSPSSSSKTSPSKKKKKSLDLPAQAPPNLSPSNKRKSSNPTSSAPPALTRPNYIKIQQFFVSTWGPWAGWAQQILFLADLTKTPT